MSDKKEREDVFLSKLMCERKAKSENIPLPLGYWNSKEWRLFFKQQVLAANTLLKIYPFPVIVAAVKNKKTNWVWSLRSPQLKNVLIEENAKYERLLEIEEKKKEMAAKQEKVEIVQTENAPVISGNSKSLKTRLD